MTATSTVETAVDVRPTRRAVLALVIVCSSILLISVDATVLNVALPTLVHDLHPSSSGLEWIVDGYNLTNAVLILLGGALGDRYGRRRMFLAGLAVFGAASLMCALIHSTGLLIFARVLMGAGASMLLPASLSIIATTFEGPSRARAIGIWASVSGIGAAGGPILGGWLLQHFWWGSVFLINVPIVVVALVGTTFVIDESKAPVKPHLDPVSVVLSAGGLALVTFALISAPTKHWASGTVLGSLAGAVVLLAAFVLWDRAQPEPYVDFSLFRNRIFSTGIGVITLTFFALYGLAFLNSQLLQFVQGNDSFGVGIRFVPNALATLVFSNLAAPVAHRLGLRLTMVLGMSLLAVGIALLLPLQAGSGFLLVGLSGALSGAGMGLIIAPGATAIMGTLPPAKIGAGSGLRASVQLLGGSFGVAVVASLATSRYRSHVDASFHGSLSGLPTAARGVVSDQIGAAAAVIPRLPEPLASTTRHVTDAAFMSGLHLAALVGVVAIGLSTAACARWVPRRV